MTKLVKPIRREVTIDGQVCTLILTTTGLSIAPKRGRRPGTISWSRVMSALTRAPYTPDVTADA